MGGAARILGQSGQTEEMPVSQRGGRDRRGGGGGRGPMDTALGQQPPPFQCPPQTPKPGAAGTAPPCRVPPHLTQLFPLSWKHFPVGLWGGRGPLLGVREHGRGQQALFFRAASQGGQWQPRAHVTVGCRPPPHPGRQLLVRGAWPLSATQSPTSGLPRTAIQ